MTMARIMPAPMPLSPRPPPVMMVSGIFVSFRITLQREGHYRRARRPRVRRRREWRVWRCGSLVTSVCCADAVHDGQQARRPHPAGTAFGQEPGGAVGAVVLLRGLTYECCLRVTGCVRKR